MAAAADGRTALRWLLSVLRRREGLGNGFGSLSCGPYMVRVSEMLAPFHRDDGEGQRYRGMGGTNF